MTDTTTDADADFAREFGDSLDWITDTSDPQNGDGRAEGDSGQGAG